MTDLSQDRIHHVTDHAKAISAMKWKGKLNATFKLPCTQPMALTSAECRRTIEHFFQHGTSMHSGQGATLWALLDYLQRTGTPYTPNAMPGKGYEVRKLEVEL